MEYNVRKEEQIKNRSGSGRKDELRLTSVLGFKAVFGRNQTECKQALMGLLNAILGADEDQISELTYINPFNPQNYGDGKLSCMDIKYEAQLVTEELDEGEGYVFEICWEYKKGSIGRGVDQKERDDRNGGENTQGSEQG